MISAKLLYFDRLISTYEFEVLPRKGEIIKLSGVSTYRVKEVIHFFNSETNKLDNRVLNLSNKCSEIRLICE